MLFNSKIFGFLFCILILISGCRKDPSIPKGNNTNFKCIALPDAPQGGWNMTTRNFNQNYLKSQYDPIDQFKIYFLSDDTSSNKYILWSLNRSSNIKFKITDNVISSPNISNNSRVTFSKTDFNIYTIKSNGDSLNKLTTNGISMNPIWDRSTDNIYFNDANNLSVYKMNKTGTLIDKLKNINSQIVTHDSLIAYLINGGSFQSLYIKNVYTNKTKLIETKKINNSADIIYGFFFDLKNQFIYYYDLNGLYKININELGKLKMINSCPSETYLHYSISYLTAKIMATQIITKQINSTTLYNEYNLVEFNNDGLNPVVIIIP